MRFGNCFIAFALVLTFAALSFSQDANIELKSTALGAHERPIVHLNHEKHSAVIDCVRCHHDFDQFGNNKGSEGQACSECHTQRATAANRVPLQEAFHTQCKVCHEQARLRGAASGPVMCGECHVRK